MSKKTDLSDQNKDQDNFLKTLKNNSLLSDEIESFYKTFADETNKDVLINGIKKYLPNSDDDEYASFPFSGNKINKTHFRLGSSQIHVDDFFYAKPDFLNSKIAKLLAIQIVIEIIGSKTDQLEDIITAKDDKKVKALTIIGYGQYSELLVCYVQKYLQLYYKEKIIINFNTTSDREKCEFNNKSGKIHDHVIIIIPIANTFSTSLKIKKMLKESYPKKTIIEPYFNVLFVAPEEFKNSNNETPMTNNFSHTRE